MPSLKETAGKTCLGVVVTAPPELLKTVGPKDRLQHHNIPVNKLRGLAALLKLTQQSRYPKSNMMTGTMNSMTTMSLWLSRMTNSYLNFPTHNPVWMDQAWSPRKSLIISTICWVPIREHSRLSGLKPYLRPMILHRVTLL